LKIARKRIFTNMEKTIKAGELRKILLAFPMKPPLLEFLIAALGRRGISTDVVDPNHNHWFDAYVIHKVNKLLHNLRILSKKKILFMDHPLAHKNYRSSYLLEKCRAFNPDLVLLVRGHSYTYPVLEKISENTPMFGWWIEMEGRMEEAFREIHFFDWYFFINTNCVDEGKKRGLTNVSLLQHAVDPQGFYRLDNVQKEFDICFIGNWSHKRQAYIDALLEVTENIIIYGGKWLKKNGKNQRVKKCIGGRYIDGDALVEVYNKSRVVVNITNWGADDNSTRSGVNMRVLEVTATGSFLLTDGSRDLVRVVEPGRHVAVYEDMEDCVRQARYYLQNPEVREEIAAAGYRHVNAEHTYDAVASRIVDKYNELFRQGH
jgi:spore maturation protein CgeB